MLKACFYWSLRFEATTLQILHPVFTIFRVCSVTWKTTKAIGNWELQCQVAVSEGHFIFFYSDQNQGCEGMKVTFRYWRLSISLKDLWTLLSLWDKDWEGNCHLAWWEYWWPRNEMDLFDYVKSLVYWFYFALLSCDLLFPLTFHISLPPSLYWFP